MFRIYKVKYDVFIRIHCQDFVGTSERLQETFCQKCRKRIVTITIATAFAGTAAAITITERSNQLSSGLVKEFQYQLLEY